ncbi:pre-mRNA-splicing factor 8 [Vanrija albida]|uniref:Pre-mRNA-splicing factor 8 n=1 Tax=Vanrija albida TaxID=181172 RepID=A0ABR3Q2C1_9TREE
MQLVRLSHCFPAKYIGIWLADGPRTHPGLANNHEKEVIDYLHEVCGIFGLRGGVNYALTSGPLTASHKPLPATKDAQQRGELERRLKKREIQERMDIGFLRLPPGDEGYKDTTESAGSSSDRPRKQHRLKTKASTASQQHLLADAEGPESSDLYEDVDNNKQNSTGKRRLRRVSQRVTAEEADAIADIMLDSDGSVTVSSGSQGCNRLLMAMRKLGLIYDFAKYGSGPANDSKRIPHEYMYNSRAVRQDLLGGFVDGDGHYGHATNCFELVQAPGWHLGLIHDPLFIIRSLGYPVHISFTDPNGRATLDGLPDLRARAGSCIVFSPNDGEFDCLLR